MIKKKDKVDNLNEKKKSNIFIYILLFISLLVLYSRYIEPFNPIIREYKIESVDIPKSFDGFKIIHFSDIHYGRTVDNKYLNKIVDMINNQDPDLVFFTGDFLDRNNKLNEKQITTINSILSKIESTLGNYAVIGNHDMKYLSDYKKIMDNSFTILDNQEKTLYYNENESITLIGLADNLESKVNYELFNKENSNYTFVLVHEPDEFDNIKNYNFNIMMSGHSHNGQIRLPFIGAIYTPIGSKTYYDNYYNINNKELFVSNGIGTSSIPFRFLSKPSINLYRLYSE